MDEFDHQLLEYLTDFRAFARDCIVLRDHNTATLVPFIFNSGQEILHTVIEKQKAEKGYVRILLLKSRRFGGSTYAEGRDYWLASMNENRNVFIVGHEEKSTATLFAMAKLMQEKNPLAPATRKSNSQELIFDNYEGTGLKSQYALATARNLSAGRSQGIHYFHASEEAYWEHGDVLLDGLMQCIPPPPAETEVIRESTANGFGDTFQEEIFKTYAEGQFPYHKVDGQTYAWSNPKTDWIIVFIPWFVHERYQKEFDTIEQKEEFAEKIKQKVFDKELSEWVESEESLLKKKYRLTLEQLYWRGWCIENYCRGSLDKFHQEYPATVEEAFLSTGSNVFPKVLCDELESKCEDPILVGDIVARGSKTAIRENKHGHFRVWEKPERNEMYFMTVDVAGGQAKIDPKKSKEPDYTNIDVWNHRTGLQAAQWHGHMEYDLVGDLTMMIGKLYNYAVACVELMNHGYTVVADLDRENYPMYHSRNHQPGWMTTRKTKPMMVDSLYRAAKNSDLRMRCKGTVSEMRTFIEEGGKYNAASGCKDDRVITAAMASQMMTLLPKKFRKIRRHAMKVNFGNWGRKR